MRRLAWLPAMALSCFSGESTRGLPCSSDAACGPGIACEQGICGGPGSGANPQKFFERASILFVVSNDPAMTEIQPRLAAAGEAFVDRLDTVSGSYRIGFVSTDLGNPRCSAPGDDAQLVATSCRDRLGTFGDAAASTCESVCPEGLDGDILPVELRVEGGGSQEARPWIHVDEDTTNIKDGFSKADAFGCLAPVGLGSCRFGQPLESAVRAVESFLDRDEPAFGFYRDDELLVLVFVTPSADCSFRDEHATIFDPDGNRVFWSDPEAPEPTLATCWNAGVSCNNAVDGTYYDCRAEHFDVNGGLTDAQSAVLHPVESLASRIAAALEEAGGRPDAWMVAGLVGTPGTYDGSGPPLYPVGSDPELGIGAGCTNGSLVATPPARLRALAEKAGAPPYLFRSLCPDSLAAGLEAIADEINVRLAESLPVGD